MAWVRTEALAANEHKSTQMDQEPPMMAGRLRAICVDSRSSASASGAAEVRIEYGKNGPVALIYL